MAPGENEFDTPALEAIIKYLLTCCSHSVTLQYSMQLFLHVPTEHIATGKPPNHRAFSGTRDHFPQTQIVVEGS